MNRFSLSLVVILAASAAVGGLGHADEPRGDAKAAAPPRARTRLAAAVRDREPVDVVQAAEVGEVVYAWSRVEGLGGGAVRHVWRRDGEVVRSYRLSIGGDRFRTWSRLRVPEAGAWTVEVLDAADGRVLDRAGFFATEPAVVEGGEGC